MTTKLFLVLITAEEEEDEDEDGSEGCLFMVYFSYIYGDFILLLKMKFLRQR